LGSRKHEGIRSNVLFPVGNAFGAWDRSDVIALGQKPGESDLTGFRAALGSHSIHLFHDADICREVVTFEPQAGATKIARLKLVERANRAGEEAPPQG